MKYYYPHPERFASKKVDDIKEFSGNLILWGAGKIGGIAAHCLKQHGVDFIAYCDTASDKWGTEFCGHQIISPEELQSKYPSAAILISTASHRSVKKNLVSMGYSHLFDCASLFMEIDFDGYDYWAEPEYSIRNVEQYLGSVHFFESESSTADQLFLHVTTKCTLRCKHCSSFMPYVRKPQNFQMDELLFNLNTTLSALGEVRVLAFYGGEPLLHPDLPEMIRSVADDRRIERLTIVTNGTLLPNDNLLDAIKSDKRFWIRVSSYGDKSPKVDKLRKLFDKYDVKYEVTNYTYWDEGTKIGNFAYSEDYLRTKFSDCTACHIMYILNNKLYLCSAGASLNNIGAFPESESNYVDLPKARLPKEEYNSDKAIRRFVDRWRNDEYIDACRCCSGSHSFNFENKIPVAEQAKGVLTLDDLRVKR